MRDVLILGAYGNFGKRIAEGLVVTGVPLMLGGRNPAKLDELAAFLRKLRPCALVKTVSIDADSDRELDCSLARLRPCVVVNTCGPFQSKDYRVAAACIRNGVNYVDLADGREFVRDFGSLDESAKREGVTVVSAASTVPGLSSAVIEHFRPRYASIDEIVHGISPGQRAERGLATTRAIFSYVGKPIEVAAPHEPARYGWQDAYRQDYPVLGARWVANCDVPDLDLFPRHYGIATVRFSAGVESCTLFWSTWLIAWLIRQGVPLKPARHAKMLLGLASLFDQFGSDDGGMHVILRGEGHDGKPLECRWFIVARQGEGPRIPTVPAIVLARKLASGHPLAHGAMPCVGLVTLAEYLAELGSFPITTFEC